VATLLYVSYYILRVEPIHMVATDSRKLSLALLMCISHPIR